MLPETKMLLKRTFPSHFLPRLSNPEQKAIRKEITNRVIGINNSSNNLTHGTWEEERRKNQERFALNFEEFQKGLSKLHKTIYDQRTSTLVSTIYWDLALIGDVKEYLRAIDTNYELLRSIVNKAASLLYSFKKSEYKRFINELSMLKQRTR